MTTPPQGPWGPGQHGGQQPGQGQGGWGQQPGQPPGQPPGQYPGQPGPPPGQQPGHGGWGQQPGPQGGQQPDRGYAQQPWGQGQPAGQQQWQQQQHQQQGQPWQPGGGGGNKMPLFIGGGVVGVLLLALVVFLGVRALGGDDDPGANDTPAPTQTSEPTDQPTGQPTDQPTGDPTDQPTGGTGNSAGEAKAATDKLAAAGYQCSDLFNTPQGGHRGCFKYAETTEGEAIFQFTADGGIIGVQLRAYDSDNVNKAAGSFDEILEAIGGAAFSGEVGKVRDAVKSGQKDSKVGTAWGEFRLGNNGDTLRLSGGKSGTDSLEVPRKQFETTEAALKAGLRAKGYDCTTLCRKKVGQYGSQYVSGIGSQGGVRILNVSVSGESAQVKPALTTAIADAFAVVKGPDMAALQAWVKAQGGKSASGYVNGWRLDLVDATTESYGRAELKISYETFYV